MEASIDCRTLFTIFFIQLTLRQNEESFIVLALYVNTNRKLDARALRICAIGQMCIVHDDDGVLFTEKKVGNGVTELRFLLD